MTIVKRLLQHIFLATLCCIPLQAKAMEYMEYCFSNNTKSLREAAILGNKEEVIRLIKKHDININGTTAWGESALHFAIYNNHPDISTLLIENRANVNLQTNQGTTPLIMAMDKLKEINLKADQHSIDNYDEYKTWSNLIILLLKHGARLVIRNHYNETDHTHRALRCDQSVRIHDKSSKEKHKTLSQLHANLVRARIKEQANNPQSIADFKKFIRIDYYQNISPSLVTEGLHQYFEKNSNNTKGLILSVKTFQQ